MYLNFEALGSTVNEWNVLGFLLFYNDLDLNNQKILYLPSIYQFERKLGFWTTLLRWLNQYGREAGRNKLKNGLKTQRMHFLPVFELTSARLTVIWVEPPQCPSHQSILLFQGPIHEILAEIAQLLAMERNRLVPWNAEHFLSINENLPNFIKSRRISIMK